MPFDVIQVQSFRKSYSGVVAVENSTFTVQPGEVFGLIGPNGAGKTTTLKAVAGLLEPTNGSVLISEIPAHEPRARKRLGFLPEESPLYDEMSARSYLQFFADLYDVPSEVATERIESTLDKLELDVRNRPLGDTSKGMKRKVAIARSLVNDPDVIVYDEPASGLDPLTTRYIVDFIQDLANEGKTVLFSAHNLFHVEELCDRIAIMLEGSIVAKGSVSELREEFGMSEYRIFTSVEVPGSETVNGQHLTKVDDVESIGNIRESAQKRGGDILDIQSTEPNLEQMFLGIADEGDANE